MVEQCTVCRGPVEIICAHCRNAQGDCSCDAGVRPMKPQDRVMGKSRA